MKTLLLTLLCTCIFSVTISAQQCKLCGATGCESVKTNGACGCMVSENGKCQTFGDCVDGACSDSEKNNASIVHTINHALVHDPHVKITVSSSCAVGRSYLKHLEKVFADRGERLDVTYEEPEKK